MLAFTGMVKYFPVSLRLFLLERRTVREVKNLCGVLGIDFERTSVRCEIYSSYNPIVSLTETEAIFEDAMLRTRDRQERYLKYLEYLVKTNAISPIEVSRRTNDTRFVLNLGELIGMNNVTKLVLAPHHRWWDK